MKLTILQDDAIAEDEIIIRTATRHPCLERLIDLIKQYSITLKAYHNNREYYLPIETIYYIESVDGITYLITEKDSLLCRMSLREIEDSVQHTSFCRISKHMIVNTAHLKAVESYANHRLLLVLKNDDKVLVNRNYVEHLKKQIKKLWEDEYEKLFKNYVPYGCMCFTAILLINACAAFLHNTPLILDAASLLRDFGICMLLIIADYGINEYMEFKTYRSFVITEFLILTGIFLILNNAGHLDTLQVRSIISQILSMAVILGQYACISPIAFERK